jgi:hypothetical protein
MPKFTFFFGFLLTLAVCFPAPGPTRAYAMGSKSGFEHVHKEEMQKQKQEKHEQGTEKGKGVEEGTQQERSGVKKEKSSPEKKPRLKYRDLYECGC